MKLFIGNTETLSDWQQMLQTSKDFADAKKSDKIIGGNPYTRNELNVHKQQETESFTVRIHVRYNYKNLHVTCRNEAVMKAIQQGLV